MEYLLGATSEEKLAGSGLALARPQACEANYYVGEAYRIAGNTAEATKRFLAAADNCPRSFVERNAADVRLMPPGALSAVKPDGGLATEE